MRLVPALCLVLLLALGLVNGSRTPVDLSFAEALKSVASTESRRMGSPLNASKIWLSDLREYRNEKLLSLSSGTRRRLTTDAPVNMNCAQSVVQVALSGWMRFFMGFAPSVGDYSNCRLFDSDYCTAQVSIYCPIAGTNHSVSGPGGYLVSVGLAGFAVGLCVPTAAQCATADLNRYLLAVSSGEVEDPVISVPLQVGWGYNNRSLPYPNGLFVNVPLLADVGCSPTETYAYLEATCERDRVPWNEESSSIAMGTVIFILIGLIAISTALITINKLYLQYQETREADDDFTTALTKQPLDDDYPALANGKSKMDRHAETVSLTTERLMLNVYDGSSKRNQIPPKQDLLPKPIRTFASYFDLSHSLGDLFTVKSRNVADVDTRFFEGIRTTAMLFVLYGHTLYFPLMNLGFSNMIDAEAFSISYDAIGIYPAVLAVDVFFFLSGFLFMHLYLKQVEKRHKARVEAATQDDPSPLMLPLGPILTLKMYLHRYLRLTPLVMFVLAAATWFIDKVPSGPLSETYNNTFWFHSCRTSWWHQLLYITNLNPNKDSTWPECMGWYWYLSCDMQLFIVGPFIAASYVLFPPFFYLLVAAGVVGTAAGGAKNLVFINQTEYAKTWYRAAPYVYGFLAATLVRRQGVRNFYARPVFRYLSYFFSVAFIVSCINLIFELHKPKYTSDMVFQHFAHAWAFIAWGLGLLLFALPWSLGHGAFLSRFFGHPVFAVASKLTFGCYLIHPVVISVLVAASLNIPSFSELTFYHTFAGNAVWSFLSAMCLWVLVEFPFSQMNNALTH